MQQPLPWPGEHEFRDEHGHFPIRRGRVELGDKVEQRAMDLSVRRGDQHQPGRRAPLGGDRGLDLGGPTPADLDAVLLDLGALQGEQVDGDDVGRQAHGEPQGPVGHPAAGVDRDDHRGDRLVLGLER